MSVTAPKRTPSASANGADVPTEPIWRLSVDQYHAMVRAGILSDEDPVELLEGWLVEKATKNPPHIAVTRLLLQALGALVPEGWTVDTQNPIAASDSEPEPDLIVIRGAPLDYLDRLVGPRDTALVAEVAMTKKPRSKYRTERASIGTRQEAIVSEMDSIPALFAAPSITVELPEKLVEGCSRGDCAVPATPHSSCNRDPGMIDDCQSCTSSVGKTSISFFPCSKA